MLHIYNDCKFHFSNLCYGATGRTNTNFHIIKMNIFGTSTRIDNWLGAFKAGSLLATLPTFA